MFDIPLIKQHNDNTCGAACINMLNISRSAKIEEKKIFEKISGKTYLGNICQTSLMLKYFLDHGYQTCVACVKNPKKVLKICSQNSINVIMLIRHNKYSSFGHYVVYMGIEEDSVYVNDPARTKLRRLSVKKLKKLAKSSFLTGVTESNTMIFVNMDTSNKMDEVVISDFDRWENVKVCATIFACIKKYVKKVFICEDNGERWHKVKQN